MFGKPFNFTPQALAYDWVGGAVYASSFEPEDRLIVGKTSPAGESGIVFNVFFFFFFFNNSLANCMDTHK